MKKLKPSIAILIAILCLSGIAYSSIVYLKAFTFNEDKPLLKWRKMILNGEVSYLSVREGGESFVMALSQKASSALYYKINFKLNEYPLVSWKWRVIKFPEVSSAVEEKDKNDYAARLYVVFPFLNFSSSRFIEYVWAKNLPVGTIIKSPIANNVRLIVVRSGQVTDNQWQDESRNVYEDYSKAFGVKPHLKVGAIAMMCNSDGSKTEAESFFDDITIGAQASLKERN